MKPIRIFRYLKELDAFEVTPEYEELAQDLGIAEWTPVVWIGRLFCMDNDFGEHWFDNWEKREERRLAATQLGVDADRLLIVEPDRFQDGRDGPCNLPEFRGAFWREVLQCLELSLDLIFEKARTMNATARARPDLADLYLTDLEERIDRWRQRYASSPPNGSLAEQRQTNE